MRKIKSQVSALIAPAVAGALLVACRTGEVFVSPPLDAWVVDAANGSPIANVKATMWSTEASENQETGKTTEDGHVRLSRIMGTLPSAFPFVGDRKLPATIVRFEAKGFVTKEIHADRDDRLIGGMEPVRLERLPEDGHE
jgi:anti-sigma factor RsiW